MGKSIKLNNDIYWDSSGISVKAEDGKKPTNLSDTIDNLNDKDEELTNAIQIVSMNLDSEITRSTEIDTELEENKMNKVNPTGSGSLNIQKIKNQNLYVTIGDRQTADPKSNYSVTIGTNQLANGIASVALGQSQSVTGAYSMAVCFANEIRGSRCFAEGDHNHIIPPWETANSPLASHAEGWENTVSSSYSHAEGQLNIVSGICSHAEGWENTVSGICSHAEGESTRALGSYSHTEGCGNIANGHYSHVEGHSKKIESSLRVISIDVSSQTLVVPKADWTSLNVGDIIYYETENGDREYYYIYQKPKSGAIVLAGNTIVYDINWWHISAYNTANGTSSHAEGNNTVAFGDDSHVSGKGTIAIGAQSNVFGTYNIADVDDPDTTSSAQQAYIEIVGNGTSNSSRSNARTLDWGGNETLQGKLTANDGIGYKDTELKWNDNGLKFVSCSLKSYSTWKTQGQLDDDTFYIITD